MITAAEPGFKSYPVTSRVLSYAILAGLLLGAGVGWVRESWYRVFRTSKEVEDILGRDSISLLPLLPTKKSPDEVEGPLSGDPKIVARKDDPAWTIISAPFSRYAEEVRSIKLAIDVNRIIKTNKIVG